jgi:S-(hydroxymethyl)glutathione dehydrogenase/alcohol dehydrogenase
MRAVVLRQINQPAAVEELTLRPVGRHEVGCGWRPAVWPSMGAGTLAEQTLLPAAAVVKVDPSLPLDLAALLGCAVTTGVGAVMRTAAVRPRETVLVIGCGGVGLAAIQGARLAGAAQIIAADRVAAQLETAIANGATDTVDASEVDLVTAVRELTGGVGVDHGIEVVGTAATIRAAYDATRRGGTVTLVGAAGIEDTVTFPALSLMADGKTCGEASTAQAIRRATSRRSRSWPAAAGSISRRW